jgi:hypothetical protein
MGSKQQEGEERLQRFLAVRRFTCIPSKSSWYYCNIIEAPCLVNGGHSASLRQRSPASGKRERLGIGHAHRHCRLGDPLHRRKGIPAPPHHYQYRYRTT